MIRILVMMGVTLMVLGFWRREEPAAFPPLPQEALTLERGQVRPSLDFEPTEDRQSAPLSLAERVPTKAAGREARSVETQSPVESELKDDRSTYLGDGYKMELERQIAELRGEMQSRQEDLLQRQFDLSRLQARWFLQQHEDFLAQSGALEEDMEMPDLERKAQLKRLRTKYEASVVASLGQEGLKTISELKNAEYESMSDAGLFPLD